MESVNEKLRKEYEKRKTYNPNIQKMVDEGRSRGSYMLPSMLNYKGLSNAEVKAKRKSIPKPIDTASGMIDWSKSYKGNFDLLGRTAEVVETPAPSLLLDLYPDNTVLAQSVRKLRTAYAGNAEEVRVNTGGQPQFNIGFNGEDLDEAALVANANGNDAFITNWYDQEDSNNFLQSTASRQPQVVNAGAIIKDGGKPTIDFGNGGLSTSSAVDLGGANEVWLIMAINVTSTSTQIIFESGIASAIITGGFSALILAGKIVMFARNQQDTDFIQAEFNLQTGFQILALNYKGGEASAATSLNLYKNGVEITKQIVKDGATPTSFANHKHYLGARDNSILPFSGNISEHILKTGNQSTNRAGIEANMAAYYGITI